MCVNVDSSSDNGVKRPLSPGPPPPPLRGIPHVKGPPNPTSRPPTPLTSPTHASNLSEIISSLRSGQGIDLSNISPPPTDPNSEGTKEKLREPIFTSLRKPGSAGMGDAYTSSNESLGSTKKKTTPAKKKSKRSTFHQSPKKQFLAQPVEAEFNKMGGTRAEELPAAAAVPSSGFEQHHLGSDPQKNMLVSTEKQSGNYSTSSVSSDLGEDMESRDKFDPGMAIVLSLHFDIN